MRGKLCKYYDLINELRDELADDISDEIPPVEESELVMVASAADAFAFAGLLRIASILLSIVDFILFTRSLYSLIVSFDQNGFFLSISFTEKLNSFLNAVNENPVSPSAKLVTEFRPAVTPLTVFAIEPSPTFKELTENAEDFFVPLVVVVVELDAG